MTGIDGCTTSLRTLRQARRLVSTLSDAELVERARRGHAEAYATLYRRHMPYAIAMAKRLLPSYDDVEDVVSTAFMWTFRAIAAGRGPTRGGFGGYLLRAVRSAVSDRRRVRVLRVERSTPEHHELDRAVPAADGWIDEIDPGVRDAMGRLPERWSAVLAAIDVHGHPVAVVGAGMGLSPNATTVLARRARAGLRHELTTRPV